MDKSVLLAQESHFAFGKNWASYARTVTDSRIAIATAGLQRLVGDRLAGKRFLDIGCGSGLHSLSALRLGASEVVSLDLDRDSVETARALLQANAAGQPWRTLEMSVFDLDPKSMGQFDIVYSWGVLHHTGDMCRALRCAAALVAPGGLLVFALYRRTRLCWLWKIEKRWYSGTGRRRQALARAAYIGALRLRLWGKANDYVANYASSARGMDFYHDVHDWLGGWPYESVTPSEVKQLMLNMNLHEVAAFTSAPPRLGLFGTGCDEYVYARPQGKSE